MFRSRLPMLVLAAVLLATVAALALLFRSSPTGAGPAGDVQAPAEDGRAPERPEPSEPSVPSAESLASVESVTEPEREPAPRERAETQTRWMAVGGTVQDRLGRALPAIKVMAYRPGFRGIGGTVVAEQETELDGRFSLQVPRETGLVLEASSEQYHLRRMRVRPGGGGEHDLVLESIETTELQGLLVDPEGRPLQPADLYRLFPELDPLPDEFLLAELKGGRLPPGPAFDQFSRLVVVAAKGLGQNGGERFVDFDPETARFRAVLDGRFEGELVLVFRGQNVERRPWRAGDPEVRMTVDVDALFAALGRIEVEVFAAGEAGTRKPLPSAEVELVRESRLPGRPPCTERLGGDSKRPLAIDGVPPGRYLAVARAQGLTAASEVVDVAEGGLSKVQLELARPASVRIFLRFPEEPEWLAEQLDFTYLDRNNAEHRIEVTGVDLGDRLAAEVAGAPVGPGAFLLDDSVLRVDLKPGENPDLEWELQPVGDYRIEVQLFPAPPSPYDALDRFADGWLSQFDPSGFRIGARHLQGLLIDQDGWVVLEGSTAAGRYLWRIDFGEIRRIDTRLEIGAGGSNTFRFPLR